MSWTLADAEITLRRGWLPPAQADALAAGLREQVAWEVHYLRIFGREVASPRLSCWMGDPEAVYRYSGSRFVPQPWAPVLQPLRQRLAEACGEAFNSVLLNRYRDGRDATGWHSDDEPELGPAPVIASLSLGARRRFLFRRRHEHRSRQALELGHGDLLLMAGATQAHYQHALPRTARPVGERINLTFRRILAPA